MKSRKTGTQQSPELVFSRPDGALFHGYLETSPHEDDLFGKGWRVALVDITRRKRAEMELKEANELLERSRDDLRRLASELVLTEERERKMLAMTLHDEVAQTLAAVRMRMDELRGIALDDEHRQAIEEAREHLSHSIRQTRALMKEISNPILYDLGLPSAVEALVEPIKERHGIQIKCSFEGDLQSLSQDLNVILFRIVKELLQNVIKHSGARGATVRILEDEQSIRTIVADDGVGFKVNETRSAGSLEGGFGLFSIRERVKSLSGNIQVKSRPGIGSEVIVELPKAKAGKPAAKKHLRAKKT